LSEKQHDQIFAIKHAQEAFLYEQEKIIRNAHFDLHKLAASDQYDEEKAKAISEKMGKALSNMFLLRVQEMHQIYALLTPEQRKLIGSSHAGNADWHSMHHPKHPSDFESDKTGTVPHQ
jgi:Spy/CpxP family protein refolding chaperone